MRLHLKWLLWLGLWGPLYLFSQTTPKDTVPSELYEAVFTMHQAKQHWLRVDLLQLVGSANAQSLRGTFSLAYEQKIKPAWSLVGEYRRPYLLMFTPNAPRPPQEQMSISLGTRFYYQLPRHLAEGSQANNFSANYLGVSLGSRFTSPLLSQSKQGDAFWYTDNLAISVMGGVQRMIFRFGFFDFAFGLRLSYGDEGYARFVFSSYVEDGWQIFPVGEVRMGLGI
jgi:hypothetical protein